MSLTDAVNILSIVLVILIAIRVSPRAASAARRVVDLIVALLFVILVTGGVALVLVLGYWGAIKLFHYYKGIYEGLAGKPGEEIFWTVALALIIPAIVFFYISDAVLNAMKRKKPKE